MSPTTASLVDQVEISWLFNFDAVTAQIDLEYEDGDDDDNDGVEQAFVNLALSNGDVHHSWSLCVDAWFRSV